MRRCRTIALALAFALAGCAEDDPVIPPAPPAGPGTPLTAAGAIEAQTPLLWSAATDEVVAVASFNDPYSNSLIAVGSISAARRTLDTRASTPLSLTADGAGLYYVTLDLDSTISRSLALSGPGAPQTLNRCGSGCFHAVLPSPDPDRVALYPVSDSLAIMTLSTGVAVPVTRGLPVAFSPDGTRLLKREINEPIQDAVIFDLTTRTTSPANLGLPDPIGEHRVRWTAAGIEVLYQSADRHDLFIRRVTPMQDAIVYTTPDSLEPLMDWAPPRIAVWTSKAAGSGRSYRLTVIHGDAAAGGVNDVVTTPLLPGHPVLPPDGANEVVYAIDRRLYRGTFVPPASAR